MVCVYTPPHRKFHDSDFTRERILLAGSNTFWKQRLLDELIDSDVDVYDAQFNPLWELEHSFIATVIPLYFSTADDAPLMSILGRHNNTGKVIPCCTPDFPFASQVKAVCDFDSIPVLSHIDDLVSVMLTRIGCTTSDLLTELTA